MNNTPDPQQPARTVAEAADLAAGSGDVLGRGTMPPPLVDNFADDNTYQARYYWATADGTTTLEVVQHTAESPYRGGVELRGDAIDHRGHLEHMAYRTVDLDAMRTEGLPPYLDDLVARDYITAAERAAALAALAPNTTAGR